MKSKDLLKAFTDLDDDVILDAQKADRRRPARRHRLSLLLAAALAASSIAVTAFASSDSSVWFRNFFTQKSDAVLSESQKSYISENTASYQQSQTMNGYTITLESAISDGVKTLIQFKVTAPEEVALDLDIYTPRNWGNSDLFVNETGTVYSTSGGWNTIDEDKSDNEVMLLYESDNNWYEKNIDRIFGHTWTLRLVGLDGQNRLTMENIDDPPRAQHITDGIWEFKVEFPESGNETLEFISEPVSCPAKVNIGIQGYHYEDVQITSLKVRALSVALTFRHPDTESVNAFFDHIYVVMKDGSRVVLNPSYGAPNFLTFDFAAPIVLEDIDHILLPNDTKLFPLG